MDNDQREIIYSERMKVLNGDNMRDAILKMVQEQVEKSVDRCISEEIDRADWNLVESSTSLCFRSFLLIRLQKRILSQSRMQSSLSST